MKHTISALFLVVATAAVVSAQPPGGVEVTCDVEKRVFRFAARNETTVTFRLWDDETGGSQCGSDHVVAMDELLVLKAKPQSFDGVRRRAFLSMSTVLGSDASPAVLCAGPETWLDVTVGATIMTCDYGLHQKPAGDPPARRRLQSVAFAQVGPRDISARVHNTNAITLQSTVETSLPFNAERWDTDSMHDLVEPTKLQIGTAGKYMIFGHVAFVGNSLGLRYIHIRLNGLTDLAYQTTRAVDSNPTDLTVATHYELSPGDFVELRAYQDSGGPLDVLSGPNRSPEFGAVKLP